MVIKMPISRTFLGFLFISLSTAATGQRVITEAGNCIRQSECNTRTEYCSFKLRCHARGSVKARCSSSTQCKRGLYCDRNGVCTQQKGLFEKCNRCFDCCAVHGNTRTICSPISDRCIFSGLNGNVCGRYRNSDCQHGYYCQRANYGENGKCSRKKPEGSICGLRDHNHDVCRGFCSRFSWIYTATHFKHGVCVTGSKLGEPCTEDQQCVGHRKDDEGPWFERNFYNPPPVQCNVPKGSIGICEHEHKLLKKEGKSCNLRKDRCDAKRGLSCRRTPNGARCMLNVLEDDQYATPFCDIHGNLSRCNLRNGISTVCRKGTREGLLHDAALYYSIEHSDALYSSNILDEFFVCRKRKEIIPRGWRCHGSSSPQSHRGLLEHAVCEKGTTCRQVHGLRTGHWPRRGTAGFCAVVKKEGEKCFSKFRDACGEGLKCHKHVCVKGNPDTTITHADVYNACDVLPCVPGTQCMESYSRPFCDIPQREANGQCLSMALQTYVSSSTLLAPFPLSSL